MFSKGWSNSYQHGKNSFYYGESEMKTIYIKLRKQQNAYISWFKIGKKRQIFYLYEKPTISIKGSFPKS